MSKPKVVFDPFSDDFFNSPYDTYRRMREETPVYYDEKYDFYALTRHEDVAPAYKNHETYSSARGTDLATVRSPEPPTPKSIIYMDPPDHRAMRSLLNKVFTPRAIQAQKQTVVDTIDHYLSAANLDQFDVVQDFSAPFPVEVITAMLGVPPEHRQQIRLWVDATMRREPGQVEMTEAGLKAVTENAMFYLNLLQERRDDPRDDLFSQLLQAEIERENGERTTLEDLEIAGFAVLLGAAGAETVTKLIGNAAVLFGEHPDQWQKLLDDPTKIPAAVEELLRYQAPSQYNVRWSLKDVCLHGVTIPAGNPVFLINGSANRDGAAWTDADKFDIDRDPNEAQNLGFGYGIHSCLGAALARLESAIALEKLLDFMPRYEVEWDGCQRVAMQNVAGWQNVPVTVIR